MYSARAATTYPAPRSLLRDVIWALATRPAKAAAMSGAYAGTVAAYADSYAAALSLFDDLGFGADSVASVVALIADLSAV